MNQPLPQPGGILVIANRTCPCPTLVDEVARRAGTTGAQVLVVAPALNSRLRHWVSDVDGAVAQARDRVGHAVGELRERGSAPAARSGTPTRCWRSPTHWPTSPRRSS